MTQQPSTLSAQLAPYSQEAEEALLGSILVNPEEFIPIALYLKPEDYYILRHAYIWEAYERISKRGEPIDYVTVQDELRALNRLDDIGGAAYLIHLINSTPSSVYADTYARLVQRAAIRRRLLIAADEIKALAMDEQLNIEKVTADAESRIVRVTHTDIGKPEEELSSIVARVLGDTEYHMLHPDQTMGIPSGFRDLDDLLGGFRKTSLYTVAARPGIGKTSLVTCIILNAAKLKSRIGFFTQEMSRDQIVSKMFAIEAGITTTSLYNARLSPRDWSNMVEAAGKLGNLPIYVDDASRRTPDQIRKIALRWINQYGLDMIVVDYLQILSDGGLYRGDDIAKVSYFADEMKQIAKELNIPVIALSQLNRELEKRADKRPQLSDLKQSGKIEEDSDVVIFIYRDAVYNEATEFPNRADLLIAKNRHGSPGTISLHFERSNTKFTDQRTQTIDLSQL